MPARRWRAPPPSGSAPHPETMVAVTGTNGKTSVATFCRQLWTALGHAAINVGTTGVQGAFTASLGMTTPDSLILHDVLARAEMAGVTHAAMEASSHGLDQRRLEGVTLAAAGFTKLHAGSSGLSPDDGRLFRAKMGLFDRLLPEDGVAVVNLDDPAGPEVARIAAARGAEVIGTGRHPDARLRLTAQRFDATGQDLLFTWQGASQQVRLSLIGGFQAQNALVAAGLVIAAGDDPDRVFQAMAKLGMSGDGWNWQPRGPTAPRSMSIMPIRPMRSRRR